MNAKERNKIQRCLIGLFIILVLIISSIPITIGMEKERTFSNNAHLSLGSTTISTEITHLSKNSALPGEIVHIFGNGFGSLPGYIVLSGLRISPESWSENDISYVVPEFGSTGLIYVRDSSGIKSNSISFTVERELFDHQYEPHGFTLDETGLFGSASLVETDGEYIYGITGFETLCTYQIITNGPNELCSIDSLAQRISDIRIHDGYLYCTGDHGLYIFRTEDLQEGDTNPVVSIAGGSYFSIDIKEKNGIPIQGKILALCEYLPRKDSDELHIPLFQFESEELIHMGSYSRSVISTERQHAIAIDPLNPKVYVSGYETLLGEDKYILEIDISDPSHPLLNHREEMLDVLGFDMETKNNILWMGISSTGTELFKIFTLQPGTQHLLLNNTVEGIFGLGRTTRVKIIDEKTTVGVAWSGARPDVYLLDTFNSQSTPLTSTDSIDWAFDVSGYSIDTMGDSGKIIVADEWGGFLTYEYQQSPSPAINHQEDYDWTPASAMTENLFLTDERIYIANRGAGIWSADRDHVSDYSEWRNSEWDWTLEDPQPYPISALCVREDLTYGTLIAARANNKAMAWGDLTYGILCKETMSSIQTLAISEAIDPQDSLLSGGPGLGVIWPETDLVFMATGTDGFRAFIIDPGQPSITIHKDCQSNGFYPNLFGTNRTVCDIIYYRIRDEQKIITASGLAPFVNEPTILVFDVAYPEGIPDRNDPERDIVITLEESLQCLKGKAISYFDINEEGYIAAATTLGMVVFHVSWIPLLNELNDAQAWNLIKIPLDSYEPWWDTSFSAGVADVNFGDDNTLYVVKQPQGDIPGGVWCLHLDIHEAELTHNSIAKGYYPGVQCGIDYNQLLQGWGNPDITTLHHPYGLVADGNTVFVTGWSGKIDKLIFSNENQPPSTPEIQGPTNGKVGTSYSYSFTSTDPEGEDIFYYIDWGDGKVKEWIGPYTSGSEITIDHSFSNQGTFIVKTRTRDEDYGISGWSQMEVSMPKAKYGILPQFFIYFLKTLN